MAYHYQFRCNACGHEEYIHLGLIPNSAPEDIFEYVDYKFREERQFKKDVLGGKYGDYIAKVCAVDPEKLFFSASECLVWCTECKALGIGHDKYISSKDYEGSEFSFDAPKKPYSMQIRIRQKCKSCGGILSMIHGECAVAAKCPKCGEIAFRQLRRLIS